MTGLDLRFWLKLEFWGTPPKTWEFNTKLRYDSSSFLDEKKVCFGRKMSIFGLRKFMFKTKWSFLFFNISFS